MWTTRISRILAAAVLGAGTLSLAAAGAQDPPGGEKADPQEPARMVEPKAIWPAGLEKLAGRYVFYQVSSPGGLWENHTRNGRTVTRQVSINEVPAALRDRLTRAEIVISDLKMPTVEASERLSPSKRGMLRFYAERAEGKLSVRGLPGVGGFNEDTGTYGGPVVFHLQHTSHSNPSVPGVLQQRVFQERTWGAATLDYADLTAIPLPKEPANPAPAATAKATANGKAAPANGKAAPANGKAAAPPKPGEEEDHEPPAVLANARTLRSGVEIFSFIEWRQSGKDGDRLYTGSVRLLREDMIPKEPQMPLRPTPSRLMPQPLSRS